MTIRAAKFGDIPRLAELMEEAFRASIYADRGNIDERVCKGLFMNSMQKHGGQYAGSTLVNVCEKNGVVEGFLLGAFDRVYHVGDKLMASDVFFHLSPRADPRDAIRLLNDFLTWAEANPLVVEIKMGVTNILGDWTRLEPLYRRKGFDQCGALFEKRIQR